MRGEMMSRVRERVWLPLLALFLLVQFACAPDEDLWDRTRLEYPPLPEVKLPDVERTTLPNGMVLYILEDHEFPIVRGEVLVRAGSMLDPVDKVGLADMTGTVLRTGGSERYPGDDLDRRLESIGASIELGLGQTDGFGSFWCLKENTEEVLQIFADLLRNPAFPEEKLDLAKVSLRQQIASRNDEPLQILLREIGKVIWGEDHPYARHPEYATVEAVTREDLISFHKNYFFSDRIYLTVWGDFEAKKVRQQITQLFGDWAAAGTPPPEQPAIAGIAPGGRLAYAEKTGMTNTWIMMGHVGIRADDPDYAAMNVLAEILGGGAASRIFNEIRTERGLAYAAGSSSGTSFSRPGAFYGYAGTRSDSALVVLELLREEIRKITEEPVTEEELSRAKDGILDSYVFQYASKGRIATRMSYLDFYGYPEDFTARYPEQIKELTAADLLATAKRRIHPDDLQIVIVGNEGDFAEPLSSLGIAYETIDLTIPEPPSTFEIPEETQESFAEGKRLLAEAAEATGGIEAWTSIRDIAAEVEMAVTVQGMNLSVFISSIHTSDGRGYVSQVLPFGEVIMAFDGEEGWKKSPQGIEAMAPEEREEMLNGRARDFSEIFAKIDAIKAQALGRQEFADRECEVVLLSGERLSQVLLFLDPETKMPVGMRHRDRAMGGPVEATRILDDFRSVGPVKMAHSIEILHDGEPFAKAIVKKMVINGGVDETKFARPE